jgi:sugar phosphate isomerase/epimerase
MHQTDRREFLSRAASTAAAGLFFQGVSPAAARKMKMCLNTGNIGVRANLAESIDMAAKYGFEAVDPNLKELAALSDGAMSELLAGLKSRKLEFGSYAQSVPVTQTDEKFAAFIKDLEGTARTLQRAGMKRMVTWLSSSDNNLTYLQNFRLHAKRIGEAATVLGNYGVSLGLEYIGPKTGWSRGKYPFIHTLATMKELIAETGKPNLGYLLDAWHWYNAGDTVADLLTLKNQDIVAVHINDAPAGIPVNEQVDNRRALPLATGVIDIAGFMNAINDVGYDGPVAAEPMSAELRALPPDQALAQTAESVKKAFALIKS